MISKLAFLLLQIRHPRDPMCRQEVEAFSKALGCSTDQIETHNLVFDTNEPTIWSRHDMVFIGGSGDFSVVTGGDWLASSLECMRELVQQKKPTFASCWGFQALAKALGGKVVTDLSRAEIGTPELFLTDAGQQDPVFGTLPNPFCGSMGHQDIVDEIPDVAVCLASSPRVQNEAFRIEGAPIYATQFHPELTLDHLMGRLTTYPEYIERIAGVSAEEFTRGCVETPEANGLLRTMVEHVFDLSPQT